MVGFIIASLFLIMISCMIGGLPSLVLAILLEMKGLGSYLYALTILIASVVELIKFISYIIGGANYELSIKDIPKMVKSIFKKDQKEKKKLISQSKNRSLTLNTIEVIILLGFVLYAIFGMSHSFVFSLIYDNVVVRIIAVIFIPLVLCNIINGKREDEMGIFSGIFIDFILPIIIGFFIAAPMLFAADVWYKDISESIQSWFIYDNNDFDDLREKDDFKGEYEYLKSRYEQTYNSVITTCDINEPACLETVRNKVINGTNIKEYGYTITSDFRYSPEIEYLCIADKKTKKYKFYKLTYKGFSFELSSQEEFENKKKEKNNS